MTQNHCFSKKYQPVVLKTTLEVCLKNISTFTEHYGLLEYLHHENVRESSRTVSIILFSYLLWNYFLCAVFTYTRQQA